MCLCPQEHRWAEVQDRAARKATELKSLNMAIHSLFQAASTRLQPKGKVAAGDSHRQLEMVTPGHSSLRAQEEQQERLPKRGEPPDPTSSAPPGDSGHGQWGHRELLSPPREWSRNWGFGGREEGEPGRDSGVQRQGIRGFRGAGIQGLSGAGIEGCRD